MDNRVRLPKLVGIVPISLLLFRYIAVSCDKSPKLLGMVLLSALLHSVMYSSFFNFPRVEGILPVRWLESKCSCTSSVRLLSEGGNVPRRCILVRISSLTWFWYASTELYEQFTPCQCSKQGLFVMLVKFQGMPGREAPGEPNFHFGPLVESYKSCNACISLRGIFELLESKKMLEIS